MGVSDCSNKMTYRFCGLKQQNLFSHRSRSWKSEMSEIRVPTRLGSMRAFLQRAACSQGGERAVMGWASSAVSSSS